MVKLIENKDKEINKWKELYDKNKTDLEKSNKPKINIKDKKLIEKLKLENKE